MEALSVGVPAKLFDADVQAAPVSGAVYSIPGTKVKAISWRTFFASAPTAASIKLLQSTDGAAFYDLDVSTATAGEMRLAFTAAKFVRAQKATQTGGGALTVEINIGNY